MQQVEIEDAKDRLSDLVEAAVQGTEVVLTKDHKPVAKLVPVPSVRPHPVFGSARALIRVWPDFDEPLEDFVAYK